MDFIFRWEIMIFRQKECNISEELQKFTHLSEEKKTERKKEADFPLSCKQINQYFRSQSLASSRKGIFLWKGILEYADATFLSFYYFPNIARIIHEIELHCVEIEKHSTCHESANKRCKCNFRNTFWSFLIECIWF